MTTIKIYHIRLHSKDWKEASTRLYKAYINKGIFVFAIHTRYLGLRSKTDQNFSFDFLISTSSV